MGAALKNKPEVVIKIINSDLRSDCTGCIYGCGRTLPTPNDWENSEKPITYFSQWSSIYSFPALVANNNFGSGAFE